MRKTENITRKALKIYCSYHPWLFPLRFGKIFFESVPVYFNLWVSAEIVTALYEGRQREEVWVLVSIALCGNLAARVLAAFFDRGVQEAGETLRGNEAAVFHRKTLEMDYDKLEDPQIRLLRRRIEENLCVNGHGVRNMEWGIDNLMSHCVNIVFSLTLLSEMLVLAARVPFRWQGGILFAAMIGFLALSALLCAGNVRKVSQAWGDVGDVLLQENRYLDACIPSGLDNRIYRQQVKIDSLYEKARETHWNVNFHVRKRLFLLGIPETVTLQLSEICAYLVAALYCILGAFPIGSIIKYVGCLNNLLQNIGGIFWIMSNLKINEPFLEPYLEFLALPNEMYQGSLTVEKRSDKKFDIAFRNVSFRYAGAGCDALKNVSIELKVGERLAVVGENGSGKTTFIKLLCRLYDPTEGEIYMNDFNIRKYDYHEYLALFSVVFQDYQLLALPLGSNIAAAAAWDGGKAERLLHKVGFGERYAQMPRGLETPLYQNFDEEGVNVSGGEAQKIALARALYRDAPFIILDEPTAALDPVAEAEIYTKFNEIVEDKTAIYISHRLSSCRFCDRIAVFDEGRIVQIGTHEELLADTQGKYHELWQAQAQYYA